MLLRNFFRALGLVALGACWSMNPDTAQFKDVLALLHALTFWKFVGIVVALLIGLELAWSGGFSGASKTACWAASPGNDRVLLGGESTSDKKTA